MQWLKVKFKCGKSAMAVFEYSIRGLSRVIEICFYTINSTKYSCEETSRYIW